MLTQQELAMLAQLLSRAPMNYAETTWAQALIAKLQAAVAREDTNVKQDNS